MGIGGESGGHAMDVNAVRFSNDGRYLASGSDDEKILIWEIKAFNQLLSSTEERLTFKQTKILKGHQKIINDINWSPCDRYLVSGANDNWVLIWDIEKEQ